MWCCSKGFSMLLGKEINSSVGDEMVISSTRQNKISVQVESHRFQTLSALTNLKHITRSKINGRREALPIIISSSCFTAGL